ncbi:hypothetical protein GCM10011351_05570 [Paraliobacillus quinghaiensis]|uniref:GerMN domain-containing protein n=1 Tax=Paraliobacillus quinghaiensis TaxID=470815 RepID=A0A917THA3_9BACI|nr:hypothetical protein [Paraliobacillus quinghaiensis]GGM22643.1 hypothetical protein GCM10011351_05570 [Paraliobacillus quinghaiensis]
MKHNRTSENNLEQKLKNMPKINDSQSKDVLFNKIQEELTSEKKQKRYLPWLIPSCVALVASALIFIFVQSSITSPFETANEKISDSDRMTSSSDEYRYSLTESEELTLDSSDDGADIDGGEESTIMQDAVENIDSMVFYQQYEQEELFTIAVAGQYNQYAIPITLVDASSTGDPIDYYNRIDTFVDEEALGVATFPFKNIKFEFTNNNQQIYMKFPEGYQFPDGESNAYMFQQIVNLMFSSYGIDELIIQSDSGEQVDLGIFGTKETFPLQEIKNQVYKIYQLEDKQRLLVPTSNNQVDTIDEAFKNMQINEEDFNVKAPIPLNTSFEIIEKGTEQFTIAFSEFEQFGNNQTTANMIEAVLMTAKSFGYQTVEFIIPIDNKMVGDYAIQESIPVPDGVNPKILH